MKVIAISGKKRAGKDQAAQYMMDYCEGLHCVKENFADPLKRECADATGIDITEFYDDRPERYWLKWLGIGFLFPQLMGPARKERWRRLLQYWGTDFRREMCGYDYWTNKYKERIKELEEEGVDLVVTTDLRFPNEVETVKQLGGALIRVERPNLSTANAQHISEVALDDDPGWHLVIHNEGSKQDLRDAVSNAMEWIFVW